MPIEDGLEDWKSIAKKLKDAGMKKEDISTAELFSGAVHTLDKLAFEEDIPFRFYPSKFDEAEHSPGVYDNNIYHVYVQDLHKDFQRFKTDLEKGWPPYTHQFITQDLIAYSLGIQMVRLRAQEQLNIGLFTKEHGGKITKIPILNKIIEAEVKIPELMSKYTPERFDAHVIGSYAAMMAYEGKRDGIQGESVLRILAELVKLDSRKV